MTLLVTLFSVLPLASANKHWKQNGNHWNDGIPTQNACYAANHIGSTREASKKPRSSTWQ